MSTDDPIDAVIQTVAAMDRDGCKAELRRIDRPTLDFTDEYLDSLTIDRLRHVLMAAHLQRRKRGRAAVVSNS
jgi:hypothetical protein